MLKTTLLPTPLPQANARNTDVRSIAATTTKHIIAASDAAAKEPLAPASMVLPGTIKCAVAAQVRHKQTPWLKTTNHCCPTLKLPA